MKLIQFIVMVYIIMITIGGIYVVIKTFLHGIIIEEDDEFIDEVIDKEDELND